MNNRYKKDLVILGVFVAAYFGAIAAPKIGREKYVPPNKKQRLIWWLEYNWFRIAQVIGFIIAAFIALAAIVEFSPK